MKPFKPDEAMLNNYIQNKLSDTETEQIELWLADHPDVMDDLELGLMFKQGKGNNEKRQIVSHVTIESPWWRNFIQQPKIALALSFIFGVFVSHLLINSPKETLHGIYANPIFIDFEETRGINNDIDGVIYIDSEYRPLVLTLEINSMKNQVGIAEIVFETSSRTHKKEIEFSEIGLGSLVIFPNELAQGYLKIVILNKNQSDIIKKYIFMIETS